MLSALLLYFIFTKIPFREAFDEIKRALSVYLVYALLLFVLSKLLAAFRLNLFFHQIGIPLTHKSNIALYLQGMFYNLFLPGGIGGDAYKGYVLQSRYKVGTRKVVGSLLTDRVSGLVSLVIYACILALLIHISTGQIFTLLLLTVPLLTILLFWIAVKRLTAYLKPVFWSSLGYSALVQLAQLGAVYCLLYAFGVEENSLAYLLVFLISSIVAIIPITIGGIGSREVVFYYGAKFLNLDMQVAVSISMLFFAISAIVSLLGSIYHFRNPKLKFQEDRISNEV